MSLLEQAAEWKPGNPEHEYCLNAFENLEKYKTHYWAVQTDKAFTFCLNYNTYEKYNNFSSLLFEVDARYAWYKFWYFDLKHGFTKEYDSEYEDEY